MTPALLSNSGFQDLILYPLIFIAGILVKLLHGNATGKTTTESATLKIMTDDYNAVSALYNQAKLDLDSLKTQLVQTKEELAQAKARLGSYELFLQSRSLANDSALKNVPVLLQAVANHLNISLEDQFIPGYEAAHSQQKINGISHT